MHPWPAGPTGTLDPDPDEARRWLAEELSDPAYRDQESLVERVWTWVTDRLPSLDLPGALPTWTTWMILALVLLAVLAVLAFAARDRWRTDALRAPADSGPVLEGPRRPAADHRSAARAALAAGDHDTALLEGYRALAVAALERTLLDDRPGRTAHEVALDLAPVFPDQAADLRSAADLFDGVRYGARPAGEQEARQVLGLEERLLARPPRLPGTEAAPSLVPGR